METPGDQEGFPDGNKDCRNLKTARGAPAIVIYFM
jgi:hypothetical protein